jgi:16S rRNA (uracil1498-N3)-methyltransferase
VHVPRFHTGQVLRPGETLLLEEAASHHLLRVLRLQPGEALLLFNGDGHEYRATVETGAAQRARVRIQACEKPQRESQLHIELGQGIARGDRMDYVLQKSVELGAASITPLWTRRTQVQLKGSRLQRKLQHWHGVIRSACEQSGRLQLVQLHDPARLDSWCSATAESTVQLLLDPRAESGLQQLRPARNVRLLIGPEGGLDDSEVRLAAEAGFSRVRLGPRVLRTETAALAAIAAIQVLWGDLGR